MISKYLFNKATTLSYSVIPSIIIISSNVLIIVEFVSSKQKVYYKSRTKRTMRIVRTMSSIIQYQRDIRATVLHAFVYSISFVIVTLPKMISILIPYLNHSSSRSNITNWFNLLGNCYYVFNFFILLVMNKMFLKEFKLLAFSIINKISQIFT